MYLYYYSKSTKKNNIKYLLKLYLIWLLSICKKIMMMIFFFKQMNHSFESKKNFWIRDYILGTCLVLFKKKKEFLKNQMIREVVKWIGDWFADFIHQNQFRWQNWFRLKQPYLMTFWNQTLFRFDSSFQFSLPYTISGYILVPLFMFFFPWKLYTVWRGNKLYEYLAYERATEKIYKSKGLFGKYVVRLHFNFSFHLGLNLSLPIYIPSM